MRQRGRSAPPGRTLMCCSPTQYGADGRDWERGKGAPDDGVVLSTAGYGGSEAGVTWNEARRSQVHVGGPWEAVLEPSHVLGLEHSQER